MKKEHFDIAKKLERRKNCTIQLQMVLQEKINSFRDAHLTIPEAEGVAKSFMKVVTDLAIEIQNNCELDFANL